MQVTGLTDIGKVRKINEDSYFFLQLAAGCINVFPQRPAQGKTLMQPAAN